jgi:hypothetical protein
MNRKGCIGKSSIWFFFDAVSTVKISTGIKYGMLILNDSEVHLLLV